MKAARVLIAAVIFLAVGVGMIFYYCHGNVGMSVGYPIADGTKLTVDITTVGVPALVGVPLVLLGALLLVIAFIAAIVRVFQGRDVEAEAAPDLRSRPREPFAE
jgi:hypothetical protein